MMNYRGSRWFKCDLHLHTTASKCFQDKNVTPTQWVDRAIEQGLNCVAVTDHNTGLRIDEIQDAAKGKNLTVFPGVEITCDTSKIHLLILFDTSKKSIDIEHFLVRADIRKEDFGEQNAHTAKSIFDIAKLANDDNALVIPAHIDEYSGLESLSTEILKKFYSLENINAVQVVHKVFTNKSIQTIENTELKKYLNDYYDNPPIQIDDATIKKWFTPVRYALDNNNLAILTFSDNPHEPKSKKHGLNGIGTRFSWIKMDEIPTLEGLRQAFLLPQFRIKNDFECGNEPYILPSLWIQAIRINKTTVAGNDIAFKVEFNPQLNTIIGGRGSGKSSILRFIRGVFNKTNDISSHAEIFSDHNEFYKKEEGRYKKGVLSEDSSIEVDFLRNGIIYKIVAKNIISSDHQTVLITRFDIESNNWINVDDEGFIDFFKFEHYSQKQIYEIAREPNALRKIIDRSIEGINRVKDEREHIKNIFLEKSAAIRTADQVIKLKGLKETQIKDLNTRIDAFQKSGIAQLLSSKGKFTDEKKNVKTFIDQLSEKESLLEILIQNMIVTDIDYTEFEEHVKSELESTSKMAINEINAIIEKLKIIRGNISELKQRYLESIKKSVWNRDFEKNNLGFNNQKQELEKQGINDISIFEKFIKEKSDLENDLSQINEKIKIRELDIIERVKLQNEYMTKCKEISTKRIQFLTSKFNNDNIKINVKPFRDKFDFENTIKSIINPTDSRGAYFNSDIENLTNICFSGNVEQKIKDVRNIFLELKKGNSVSNFTGYFKNLITTLKDAFIDELEILVPEDEIEVQYKPEGGSNFKSLSTASAGQKTTAILTFILSYGNEPLILDQPEDDLDNKHVYELIVERLKQAKDKRQIIVVTHNANIPVNGDAEYIISMNSESRYLEILHAGTVEQPKIKKEICDVMEGSEKAFKMRSQRYKFIK